MIVVGATVASVLVYVLNCTHYECKLCAFHFRHLHHLFIYEKFTRTESSTEITNEPKNGNAPCEMCDRVTVRFVHIT